MSGLIPQQFVVDLIDRADIVEVIGQRIQLKKAGREFKAVCPFHDEKSASFTVSPTKGFYHCFGCGAHGTALGFLMEYDHMDFVEAVESLAHSMGMEVPREENQRPARRYDDLFDLMQSVERHFQTQLKDDAAAVEYLKNRGIDGATAKRFGVGFAPAGWSHVLDKFGTSKEAIERLLAVGLIIRKDNGQHYDRFRERIMFPIRDGRGRTIGFGGRVMGNDEPKYLNSPETVLFHKGRELYGLFEARQALRQIRQLVVVEGYMDVVGLARHGIDFAVATLGTATTVDHLNSLFRQCDDVFFAFDGDRAGRAAAWKALEIALPQVREGRQMRFVFLPDGQDPDSFVNEHGAGAFEKALAAGQPLSDFLLDELAGQVDMTTVDGRARLAELAKPLIGRIPHGVFRELLTAKLAGKVGLPVAKLDTLLAGEPARPGRSAPGTTKRPRRRLVAGAPSVLRRAITLILHNPRSAADQDATLLENVTRPGAELLKSLVEMAQTNPDITTAGLLERWRNHEEGQHLGKLASTEIPDSEEFDVAAELAECLHQLAASGARERIDFLIEKQKVTPLSELERSELRLLGRSGTMVG
jgi:DNA primase